MLQRTSVRTLENRFAGLLLVVFASIRLLRPRSPYYPKARELARKNHIRGDEDTGLRRNCSPSLVCGMQSEL
jgi:hypothetical protein